MKCRTEESMRSKDYSGIAAKNTAKQKNNMKEKETKKSEIEAGQRNIIAVD